MIDTFNRLKSALADRYAIEREIGAGGMATVYLAEDLKHGREVAVKVFLPELAAVLGTERFQREIEIAARLNHPHILALHDSGEADGFLYYVMPHVEGESLRAKLGREKQLPIEAVMSIVRQVGAALDYAHEQGVIHRDIKPENILLHRGEAMVADFGIALAVKAAGGDRLTETGLSLGTPEYMSPEQTSGDVDNRCDIYALGCVAFEMLTGDTPYHGVDARALLARHMMDPVPGIRVVRDTVSPVAENAVRKALAKLPADRFQTASEFAEALIAKDVEPERKSIAVLPFANMSADPENEYFSDGITEEILNALAKLRDLRVAARTSSFMFKGKTADIKEVGNKLQVATVLEGSVRKAGNKLRITAQLINVSDGYHIWSERYDREMTDVFEIQDEIAAAVVEQLKVSLLGAPEAGSRAGHTDDIEAYELYLRGRYFWNQRPAGLMKAMEYFQQAVERDPGYALGHASLADGFAMIGWWSGVEQLQAWVQAKAEVQRALELDPLLAEAHACLGFIATYRDWDWALAERELLRAIELNPGYTVAHLWYSQYLAYVDGDVDAAIERLHIAHDLDPLSPMVIAHLGSHLIVKGQLEEGLAEVERALELAPNHVNANMAKGWALRGLSRLDEAIKTLERARSIHAGVEFELAMTYAHAGRLQESQAILVHSVLRESYPGFAAMVYAAMGEHDVAWDLLEKAYETRGSFMVMIRWWPDKPFDQHDPRFQDLMRRMAFP